jgi:hypothetical protein
MYSRNQRFAAMLAAAAFGAGPVLLAGPVQAAAGPSVEFSGGSVLNVLVCRSQPNAAKLTVPAESRVTFINRLGQGAVLHVDGKNVTSVGANQAVPVVFHYGPVNVSMSITCDVGVAEEFGAVTVAVAPQAAPATPVAGPVAGGGTRSGTVTTTQTGRATARSSGAPTASGPAALPVDPWAPPTGLAASAVPTSSGTGEAASGAGAPAADVGVPVAASGTPVHGPSGLLAMIATVLTIGVGVAVVRSAFARRTSRAVLA